MNVDRPLPNTYWVIPGRLLAGEYPIGTDSAEAQTRLERLREAGIDYFIALDLGEGVQRHLRCAIADTWVPNNVSQVQHILSDMRSALAVGRGVYVHCRAGIGRTGLIVGCFLAEESGDGKAALKLLNRLWRQSERAKSWPKVPQTAQQADYVRRWPKFGKTAD